MRSMWVRSRLDPPDSAFSRIVKSSTSTPHLLTHWAAPKWSPKQGHPACPVLRQRPRWSKWDPKRKYAENLMRRYHLACDHRRKNCLRKGEATLIWRLGPNVQWWQMHGSNKTKCATLSANSIPCWTTWQGSLGGATLGSVKRVTWNLKSLVLATRLPPALQASRTRSTRTSK